jgi:hypothetical protein
MVTYIDTDAGLLDLLDDINVYRSMSPMSDIKRPCHTLPTADQNISSCLDANPVTEEGDNDSDDGCTLFDLKRKREMTTTQVNTTSPSGQIFPTPPKKARMAARKRKAGASASNDDDEQPR